MEVRYFGEFLSLSAKALGNLGDAVDSNGLRSPIRIASQAFAALLNDIGT